MEKTKSTILFLLVLLLVHIEAYAGVITKSFYMPVVKGAYEEKDPEGLIEKAIEEAEAQETEIATPTDESVFVIVSEPIRIDVLVEEEMEPETGEPEEIEENNGGIDNMTARWKNLKRPTKATLIVVGILSFSQL